MTSRPFYVRPGPKYIIRTNDVTKRITITAPTHRLPRGNFSQLPGNSLPTSHQPTTYPPALGWPRRVIGMKLSSEAEQRFLLVEKEEYH